MLDDVRLRVGDGAAQRQLPARAGGRRARGDPARAPARATARARKLRRYPGLKEEYYLADFEPDPAVLDELGLDRGRSRSPSCARRPTVSLYHRFENDLFGAILVRLREQGAGRRAPAHGRAARGAAGGGRLHRPRARDRRASRWSRCADLVVSAGGTMNREAVALGTPVWTTFEGRLGAVDERLIAEGRLRRLTRPEDVVARAPPRRRRRPSAIRRDPQLLVDLLCSPLGRPVQG